MPTPPRTPANRDGRCPPRQRTHAPPSARTQSTDTRTRPTRHLCDELLSDVLLHEEAGTGAAGLALIEEDGLHDALHSCVLVRGVEHHDGRLAAQLERDLLASAGGLLAQEAAHVGGAGEGNLGHVWVVGEVRADVVAARDDVDDARRQAGLGDDVAEEEGGEVGGGRRLEHHRVAHGKSGRDLPREHQHGEVPRDDLADDAQRLPARHCGLHDLRPAGVVVEVADGERDVGVARLAD